MKIKHFLHKSSSKMV